MTRTVPPLGLDIWACFHQDHVGVITHRSGGTIPFISSACRAAPDIMPGFQPPADIYTSSLGPIPGGTQGLVKALSYQAGIKAHRGTAPQRPVHHRPVRHQEAVPHLRQGAVHQAPEEVPVRHPEVIVQAAAAEVMQFRAKENWGFFSVPVSELSGGR